MSRKTLGLLLVLAFTFGLLAVGTLSAQDDLLYPIGEGPFTWSDLDRFNEMDFGGEEVQFFGPWLRTEGEAVEEIVKYFNQATNANVVYVGSDSLEQQIIIDIQGGNPPNLTAFPQPGLAANAAAIGGLVPLSDDIRQYVLDNFAAGQSWVDLSTYPDENGEEQFYAVFYNVNLKSIVWYVPDEFEENGYEIPQTWDELIALSDQIVADGGTPWCIGIGSQANTGWPATDWVEDIMLRTAGTELYDQWVTHEIPFTHEAVQNAISMFGQIARNEAYVAGGPQAVVTTDFRDSPAGLFTIPPQCYLHRQASFIAANFPEDVVVGVDADFFYFPPIDEAMGRPVLGAGTLITITKDSPATQAFLEFLTTPLAHELWAAQGGFLSPHSGMNLDSYQTDTLRAQGEILLNADVFRFDGSDLMPGAIGAGAFWTAMVDYVNGASVEEVTQFVEDAWQDIE
ncbi:MAG TPA: ABC transporter substrate-binding protein [Spirillospora sp.]|jgi:alpha-glucoside transport system substrate-binding protein|nr:ABC transporter substrate-binding protein [Spirillospora sp.]